jgi:hypothetical protein
MEALSVMEWSIQKNQANRKSTQVKGKIVDTVFMRMGLARINFVLNGLPSQACS